MEFTLDTLVTVCAAAFLFWRLNSSSESVRKELKGDILRVEKKSEDAHRELKGDILRVEKKSEDAHRELKGDILRVEKKSCAPRRRSQRDSNAAGQH